MSRIRRRYIRISERREIYAKCGGHCAYCGISIPFEKMQVDHMTSLHNRGEDTTDNMMPSCRECNHYKKACSLEGFRKKMKKAISRTSKAESVAELCRRYDGWNNLFYFEKIKKYDFHGTF